MATLPAGRAALAQDHWLVGSWRGQVIGQGGNNQRTLRVRSVAADGTVIGTFSGEDVRGRFADNTLSFTTSQGNAVTLRRGPDGNLSGSYLGGRSGVGRTSEIILQRQ